MNSEQRIARCGSLGASVIGDAILRLKRTGERQKVALDIMDEIAAERITGVPCRQVNALKWGMDHEDEARAYYETFLTNLPVVGGVGVIRHPTIAGAHCSPDALVGDEGGLEIKCPTSAEHLRTLRSSEIPGYHLPQIYWSLACTGREWWDFLSYDPRFPPSMQIFYKRVLHSETLVGGLEDEARAFLAELDAEVSELVAAYMPPVPGEG